MHANYFQIGLQDLAFFERPGLTCSDTEAASIAAHKGRQPGMAGAPEAMMGFKSSQNPTPGHSLGRGKISSQPLTPGSLPSRHFSDFPSTQTRYQPHSRHRPYAQSPLQSFLEEEEEEDDLGNVLGQNHSQQPWTMQTSQSLKRAFGTSFDSLTVPANPKGQDGLPAWQQRNAAPMQQQSRYFERFEEPQKPAGHTLPRQTRRSSRPKILTSVDVPATSKNLLWDRSSKIPGKQSSESSGGEVSPSTSQFETGLWSPKPIRKGPAKRLLLSDNPSSNDAAPKQSSFLTPARHSLHSENRADRTWQLQELKAHSPTFSFGGSDVPRTEPKSALQQAVSCTASGSACGSVNRGSLDNVDQQGRATAEVKANAFCNLEANADVTWHHAPGKESPEQLKSIFDFL